MRERKKTVVVYERKEKQKKKERKKKKTVVVYVRKEKRRKKEREGKNGGRLYGSVFYFFILYFAGYRSSSSGLPKTIAIFSSSRTIIRYV